jgi:hypothetical protein
MVVGTPNLAPAAAFLAGAPLLKASAWLQWYCLFIWLTCPSANSAIAFPPSGCTVCHNQLTRMHDANAISTYCNTLHCLDIFRSFNIMDE